MEDKKEKENTRKGRLRQLARWQRRRVGRGRGGGSGGKPGGRGTFL